VGDDGNRRRNTQKPIKMFRKSKGEHGQKSNAKF
jgi:hypothetical protein